MQLYTTCFKCSSLFLIYREAAANIHGFSGGFYSAAQGVRLDPSEVRPYCPACSEATSEALVDLITEIVREYPQDNS